MNEPTVCHSIGPAMALDVSGNRNGCLVRIYPTSGPAGLWELGLEQLYIGRSAECELQLDDDSVSRRHAAIQRTDDGFVLLDLNSTNGTYVNHVAVTKHTLEAGDQISIGSQILKFLSSTDIERQYFETVYLMTTTDGLTNAYNRRYLDDVVRRELQRSKRYQRKISIVMMDIDHFKQINDQHGHLVGDEVLQEFSRRVQYALEDDDVFARFGGEEFTLVLSECDLDEALAMADGIRQLVAATPMSTHAGVVPVTASFGVSTSGGQKDAAAEQLLAHADSQLYLAKHSGRNRVCGGYLPV